MAKEYIVNQWAVGPYEIQAVEGHGFPQPQYPEVMYRYKINGASVDAEMYPSLDRALVSAIGARHMGPRGAGGNAVGTAADWFCVMINLTEDERTAPAEPAAEPEQEKRWCPGRGRLWSNHRALGSTAPSPVCPVCHQNPDDLGANRPVRVGAGWSSLIPDHLLP